MIYFVFKVNKRITMKKLLKIAFSEKKYRLLLCLMIVFSLGFTVASQLEVYSFGVLTRKGTDFFSLFGSHKAQSSITKEEMLSRWDEIDATKKGEISQQDIQTFLDERPHDGVVDQGLFLLRKWFPIDQNVWVLALFLVSVTFFKAITLFLYRFGTKIFTIHVCKDVRQRYFEHMQALPMSFFQEHNIGALSSRAINDAYIIADGIHSALVNYLQTPFALISTLALCFAISWQLSSIVFFGLPLLIGPIIFIARRIRRISRQLQKKQEAFSSVLVEFLRGVQTIKLYAMEAFSLKKYQEHNLAMARLEKRNARYDTSSRPILHTIGIIVLLVILLVGLWGLNLPLHEVFFFCGLLVVVYEPVKKFAEENGRIQRGAAACDRLYEILDLPPTFHDQGEKTIPFASSLSFQNVSFGYGQEPVFSNLSFTIKKGESVAIVGPTGGGKSTVVSLLTRLFEPDQGTITIDGRPIHEFTHTAIKEFFAVVPQQPFLFHDTVKENIRFGRNFADRDVQCAARRAHAEEFIVKLPLSYDSFLAEAGKTLSGGQQQRLAIARALIKDSPVLVLDEATSALDTESESHIKSMLKELKGSITQIIIAHRMSIIEDVDRIIVIEGGQKVGDGTKEELLKTCPTFQRLWMPHSVASNK